MAVQFSLSPGVQRQTADSPPAYALDRLMAYCGISSTHRLEVQVLNAPPPKRHTGPPTLLGISPHTNIPDVHIFPLRRCGWCMEQWSGRWQAATSGCPLPRTVLEEDGNGGRKKNSKNGIHCSGARKQIRGGGRIDLVLDPPGGQGQGPPMIP